MYIGMFCVYVVVSVRVWFMCCEVIVTVAFHSCGVPSSCMCTVHPHDV